jgi:hypothetical protein
MLAVLLIEYHFTLWEKVEITESSDDGGDYEVHTYIVSTSNRGEHTR